MRMAEVLKINPDAPSPQLISQAVEVLKRGGVIVYPTETLYGMGADPYNDLAVQRLYRIKGRQGGKPIPFLVKDIKMLEMLVAEIPPIGKELMARYWPGPLTLVFRAREELPPTLRGEGTIGLRISSHPIARGIVAAIDQPLTATSANPSGGEEIADPRMIATLLGDQVDLIIDAGEAGGIGSTVVDLTVSPPRVLREGVIRGLAFNEKA